MVEIKLSKMISEDRIVDLISSKKDNVLKEMTQVISTSKNIRNKLDFYKAVAEREKISSTGIGMGVAISHAKASTVSDFVIALGRKSEGISFESQDGEPTYLVVMVGAPEDKDAEFLRIISKIYLTLKSLKFRKKLFEAKTKAEIVQLFRDK